VTKPRDLANSVNATSIPGTRLENSTVTTGKVANGAVTNAKLAFDGGPLSGFRNLIINGNPLVNQRGYVSATATSGANEYTLDRWRVVTSGEDLTFSTTAGICTATAPAGGVEQVIEGASILGGTYVLNWTGTATATVDGNAVAKGGTVTLTGGTNATVKLTGGTFTKVQLEPGSVATPFEERPPGVELMLCQRYYWRAVAGGTSFPLGTAGGMFSTTGARIAVPFPVAMRTAPAALEQTGTAADYVILQATGGSTCTAVPTHNSASAYVALVDCTITGGTANSYAMLRGAVSAAYLGWSAEL